MATRRVPAAAATVPVRLPISLLPPVAFVPAALVAGVYILSRPLHCKIAGAVHCGDTAVQLRINACEYLGGCDGTLL